MKPAFSFLAVLLLLLGSCAKDDPAAGLPRATQEGKNTGGCLINGKRFVATGWGGSLLSNPTPPLFGGFSFDSIYTVDLNGPLNGRNTTVSLFFRSQRAGTYQLNKTTGYYPQTSARYALNHAVVDTGNSAEVYGTDAQHTGQVVLTFANVRAGISAGTFEFTAVNLSDPTKTLQVKSGRFDKKQ